MVAKTSGIFLSSERSAQNENVAKKRKTVGVPTFCSKTRGRPTRHWVEVVGSWENFRTNALYQKIRILASRIGTLFLCGNSYKNRTKSTIPADKSPFPGIVLINDL